VKAMASDTEVKTETSRRASKERRLGILILVLVCVVLVLLRPMHAGEWERAQDEIAQLHSRIERLNRENAGMQRQMQIERSGAQHGVAGAAREEAAGAVGSPQIAIVTAYEGTRYDVMGLLSSQTKAKYAAFRNYAYHLDQDLVTSSMTFQQKSASRIAIFKRHWHQYEWLLWTDADVLVTNPEIRLEDVIAKHAPDGSGKHVIVSKDWGGRQVNPGVTFLRTSTEGRQFLEAWEEEIALNEHHDDLLAVRDGIEKKHRPELEYVQFVSQEELNSYPHLTLKHEGYNSTTVEHHESHHLWKDGDLFVHVVNCLRQYTLLDAPCCNGIAAFYWAEFMRKLNALHEERYSQPAAVDGPETWKLGFKADLCIGQEQDESRFENAIVAEAEAEAEA